MSISSKG